MPGKLCTLTLKTAHGHELTQILQILGATTQEKSVSHGSSMTEADIGDIKICLHPVNESTANLIPNFQMSFQVEDVKACFQQLTAISGVHPILDPTPCGRGQRAILCDPDGRSFDIFDLQK